MGYEIRHDEARRLLVVEAKGAIDLKLAQSMVTEARAAASKGRLNILYDFRGAVPGDVKNSDVFWFPRNLPALSTANARRYRAALLHLPAQRELSQFWETTFTNVGLQARAFEDEAAAVAWLLEAAP